MLRASRSSSLDRLLTTGWLASLALLVALGTIGCTPAADDGGDGDGGGAAVALEPADLLPAAQAAADTIGEDSLRSHIATLAADDMGGRGPGSVGDEKARTYLEEQMKALGLEPGGPGGTWQQPFDIVGITARPPIGWTFTVGDNDFTLEVGTDIVAFSGVQTDEAVIEDAELVFVGYGIEAPEYGWNDFGDVDVSGKVLVILNNDPDWDPELFEGDRRLYYGRWSYKYEKAAEKGAIGAIIHHTTPSAGYGFNVVQSSWSGPQFELPAGDEPRIQVGAWTTEKATRALMIEAGHDLDALIESAKSPDFTPKPLGIRTSIRLTNTIERTQTANVLGKLPGSDPELAEEWVVYGAHHDHLGTDTSRADGDNIYNGALDNASGCAQVLAVAEAMKGMPRAPRRTVLFAFWAAEEQGLLGSAYFAANPTVPAGRLAANINIDGGNIWGKTRDVVYVGYGKSGDLDAVVERWAATQERTVVGDQFPDRGFFYRSDQFNLAKVGVPAIYMDTGVDFVDHEADWGREQIEAWEAEHYHQESDELVDTWVWDGMLADTRLALLAGVDIAEADQMPTWNAGDEFEDDRQAALAAAGSE